MAENSSPWLLAARPKTLGAAVAPVIMATAMAFHAGGMHLPSAIAALVGAVLIQIGTNYANDYSDFVKGTDTGERIGPTRATAARLVTPKAMKLATSIVFALVFVPGIYILYRGGWPFLVIGLSGIAAGILYTAGPYPLAYLGLGDLFVFVFFGPVAVGGTYYLQTHDLDAPVIVAGLAPGLMSVAILTVNNLRDIDGDRVAGKKTLAVRFGKRFGQVEYVSCLVGALVVIPGVIVFVFGASTILLVSAAVVVLAIPAVRTVFTYDNPRQLNPLLGRTGQLLVLFAGLFAVALVI